MRKTRTAAEKQRANDLMADLRKVLDHVSKDGESARPKLADVSRPAFERMQRSSPPETRHLHLDTRESARRIASRIIGEGDET